MTDFPRKPFLPGVRSASPSAPAKRFEISAPYLFGRPATVAAMPEAELPSIDEFLDRTPPIEEFAPAEPEPRSATEWSWGEEATGGEMPAPEEPTADWQSYDWDSAASLGSAPRDAAAEAWASTDWSEPESSREGRQSAAEALARALDQISRRIRAGELRVPGPETVQDDAAIAATLAALLGIRR